MGQSSTLRFLLNSNSRQICCWNTHAVPFCTLCIILFLMQIPYNACHLEAIWAHLECLWLIEDVSGSNLGRDFHCHDVFVSFLSPSCWNCSNTLNLAATSSLHTLFRILRRRLLLLLLWRHSLNRARAASFSRFLDHTQLRYTPSRTPLNELSVFRRDRYVHNTQETRKTNTHTLIKIWTRNPSSEVAAHPLLRPHGHWDRPFSRVLFDIVIK